MKSPWLAALLLLVTCGCEEGSVVTVGNSPAATQPGASSSSQTSTISQSSTARGQTSTAQNSSTVTVGGSGSSTTISQSSVVSGGGGCTVAAAVSSGPTRIVSKSVSGDSFTLTFDRGIPPFQATSQPTSHFTSATGAPVVLPGSAGVEIVLTGLQPPGDPGGPSSLAPGASLLLEVRRIGDMVGVVTWAVGLRSQGCPSAVANGSTLTFRFTPAHG